MSSEKGKYNVYNIYIYAYAVALDSFNVKVKVVIVKKNAVHQLAPVSFFAIGLRHNIRLVFTILLYHTPRHAQSCLSRCRQHQNIQDCC